MPTSVSKQRCRGIPFTQNNWTPESYEALRQFGEAHCLYMVLGKEVGQEGTPHIQGFLYFENAHVYPNKKFRAISNGAHDEMMRGTPKQAADYCKKGGDFWEHGTVPSQGARTDWLQAINDLHEGQPIYSVVSAQPQILPCIRALERYQQLSHQPLNRPVNVIILIGAAGTGKSRWAYDNYPDLYSKPEGKWWDGYNGNKTILLDDYYGYMPYSQLLKVCDRYPINVPVKCGYVHGQWDTVIITSNKQPETWYPEETMYSFNRRISRIEREYNHASQENEPCQEAYVPEAGSASPSV